jgi:hypothetical protein
MANTLTPERMKELFKGLTDERRRKPIPQSVLTKVFKEVDKIKKIPFKKKNWDGLHWGDNPYRDEPFTLDLPHIEIEDMTFKKEFVKKPLFYDEARIKKEGIKYVNESCIVTHKGEIVCIYITEKTDKAITKATEKLVQLGEQMYKYYPVKVHKFYSPFKFTKADATDKEKKEASKWTTESQKEPRYKGFNWMDGMIRYFSKKPNKGGGTMISYQPRAVEANDDDDFLFNLAYTYCALYELEKRYCPDVAKYRYELARDADFVGAFPNIPLERHCATGCGASLDFASSIHNDSGMSGLTETIIWNECAKGQHQLFISPAIKLVFDLSTQNAIIFQPPKIPHGTVSTGNHNGYGFVNITKANLVSKTKITQDYYKLWRKTLK